MLAERKVLKSVEVLHDSGNCNVCWLNQILRTEMLPDEEGALMEKVIIVSEVPHRCSYSKDQKEQFLQEVEGAAGYIPLLGW